MGIAFSHAKDDSAAIRQDKTVDPVFLILLLTLLGIGLVVLYSASSVQSMYDTQYESSTQYLKKQGICALLGLGCMAAFSRIPVSIWKRYAEGIYVFSILLLLSVLIVGQSANGARRWINVGGIQFQPSEIAKFSMILMLSKMARRYGPSASEFRYGMVGYGTALLGILIPLALEKHLSAIMLMGLVAAIMMFLSGTKLRYLAWCAAGAGLFVLLYISIMGYAGDRVSAWLHPESDPRDTGYQILQSLYAIGSGGLLGLGFGKSRQKYLYLPFQYNDYIFAIICEELGFLGAMIIIMLFVALIARGYWIAIHAPDRFSSILSAGLVTLIAVQTVLNLCVVSNLLPSTGIGLPFFSYGGTALAVHLGEMGIVLSVSRHWKDAKLQEEDL